MPIKRSLGKAWKSTRKIASRVGLAAVLATTGFTALPQSTVLKDQSLLSHAKAVESHFPTHLGPEPAVKIIPESKYQGLSGDQRFYAATADFTHTMAIPPDWLLGEFLAQNSRFIIDNGIISHMDPQSNDPITFNAHVLRFLKRTSLISKGPEGVSSGMEYGATNDQKQLDTARDVRNFYHNVKPEEIKQTADLYKEMFKFYRENDVELDAFCLDKSYTATMVFDLFIAQKFRNDEKFIKAASEIPEWGKKIVDPSFNRIRSAQRFPPFDINDENAWKGAFKSIHAEENKPNTPSTILDTHGMAQSARGGMGENPKSRFRRVAYYYQRIAQLFLNQDGSIKKGMIGKNVLRFIAKSKIKILEEKANEITEEAKTESDSARKNALLELAKSWKERSTALEVKYVKP